MHPLIYLDQNSLSDLRSRRIEESDNEKLRQFKYVLKSGQVRVVYSHITLDEIFQIQKEEYKQEHIDTLTELDAKYIEPLPRQLSNQTPEKIWRAYLENKKSNIDIGITSLIEVSQLSTRKYSGLKVDDSFSEINEKIKEKLSEMLFNIEALLAPFNPDNLSEMEKLCVLNLQRKKDKIRAAIPLLQATKIDSEQLLGPQPFRDIPEIKALEVQSIDAKYVVREIEEIFKMKNSNFNFSDYFEKTPQTDVVRAYFLMNWAGYYADDFTKDPKGKDRFNASNNDMQHAVSAYDVNFLISNDIKFCKKAKACFSYIKSSTIVCTPKEFIDVHCTFL